MGISLREQIEKTIGRKINGVFIEYDPSLRSYFLTGSDILLFDRSYKLKSSKQSYILDSKKLKFLVDKLQNKHINYLVCEKVGNKISIIRYSDYQDNNYGNMLKYLENPDDVTLKYLERINYSKNEKSDEELKLKKSFNSQLKRDTSSTKLEFSYKGKGKR